MNSKTLIGVVAVVVIVVAVAAVAVGMGGGGSDEPQDDVVLIYNGNGGTYIGSDVFESSSNVVEDIGFTHGDAIFLNWNTSADGTGTTYSAGNTVNASADNPVTLYAQWVYMINDNIINSASSTLTVFFVSQSTMVTFPALVAYSPISGTGIVGVNSTVSVEWNLDESTNIFTTQINGHTYRLTMSISSGADNIDYYITGDGRPAMSFDIMGPLSIAVSILPVS